MIEETPLNKIKKWKWWSNKWYQRNTKDCKKLLWTIVWQEIGQPGRKRYIPRNIQFLKTETRRSRKPE